MKRITLVIAILALAACAPAQQAIHAVTHAIARTQSRMVVSVMGKNACEEYEGETLFGKHNYHNPTVLAIFKNCILRYDPKDYNSFFHSTQ